MNEKKTINDQELEQAAGGVGVPGGPQLTYTQTRYRCPACGRELIDRKSVTPACPKCGTQMRKG